MNSRPRDQHEQRIQVNASIDRVFPLLATLEGVQAWWEGNVQGTAAEGGELAFTLPGSDDYSRVEVSTVVFPTDIVWSVVEDSGFGGQWINTSIHYHLEEELDGSCWLSLVHEGMTPALDCYQDCASAWDRHFSAIKQLAEESAS